MTEHEVPLSIPLPFDAEALLRFLGRHAVPGVEVYEEEPEGLAYARSLRLPCGSATLTLALRHGQLSAGLQCDDRDVEVGRQRVADLCDLGRDVTEVEAHLSRDSALRPLVAAAPGLRVPGTVDVPELLLRTMLGQQISLAGAANLAGKLAARFGEPIRGPGPLTRLFPTSDALAAADPATLPMPRARARSLVSMAGALAAGEVQLSRDGDPDESRARLLACPGVGPWTADYVLMRGLHCPDVLLSSDLVIRRELDRRGLVDTSSWSPWRSYATLHLWRAWTG